MGTRGPIPSTNERPKPLGRPKKPIYLKGEAGLEWNRIVSELFRCGQSAPADRAILEGYCTTYAEVREATKILNREGRCSTVPIQSASGKVLGHQRKPHPMVQVQQKALVVMKSYLDALGMSPVARRRMGPGSPDEDDELSKLLEN